MNSISEFNLEPKAVKSGSSNGIDEHRTGNLINLNEVFQRSLELNHQGINKSAPVIRCDNLPYVNGDPGQMLKLFNLLLQMVLSKLPTACSSFIYIKCELEKEDVIDMTIEAGFKKYCIYIFSNTLHIKEWIENFQQELTELKNICSNINGSFKENTSSETGCLFTITLPGKIN